jgi:2-polyprenyl-3-methyl-5-hydroxy-6-metoxy-1,4-benzoquinol methylase
MIEKLQKPTIPLLDYGCGTACLYKPFDGSKQVQITLADIESPSFTFTKWRYRHSSNIQFFDIDPEQFSLTGLFDIFICDNVLEHVLNPLELTKHLTEHLNPGGYALIDFCTQIEEYKTGHLEQSIAQYGVTMEYVHANYDRINTLFYRKK